MLPNLKFVVCGILFCVLLFAAAGTGVILPDSRTRIGEMPEVGRPMMQRSMADVPAQAQVYMMTAARRSDELERLRDPAAAKTASTQPEPDPPRPDTLKPDTLKPNTLTPDLLQQDLPKPDVAATAASDDAKVVKPPVNPTPNGAPGEGGAASVEAPPASPAPPTEPSRDDRTDDAALPRQVAAATPEATEESERPRFASVPMPMPRPVFSGVRRQLRMAHRRHRFPQQYGTAVPAVTASPAATATPGVVTGYTPPSEATSR
jgi:hypothetical protein